jgi:DNA polymerase-1
MKALLDGDIVAHRIGFTTEEDSEGIAKARCDETLDNILIETGAEEFRIFLSDRADQNFRYKLYPEYKANRAKLKRPKHLEFLKEHLIINWQAEISFGMEADDFLGINQHKPPYRDFETSKTTICSIDKDLKQIPGEHYNFVKKEFDYVEPEEGVNYFYKQILVGDTSDNIGGCPGIGLVKAEKLLKHLGGNVKALNREVFRAFCIKTKAKTSESREEIRAYIEKIGQVLKIKQKEDEELWRFQLENLMEEFPLQSTLLMQEVIGRSTDLTKQQKEFGFQLLGEKMGQEGL